MIVAFVLACASLSVTACAASNATIADTSDVIVTLRGQTVDLRVGQTMAVKPPADFPEWQVDFAVAVLKPLTATEKMRSPGPDGWRFEAAAEGETDLVVTAVTPPGSSQPAPPSFQVKVRVRAS